MTTAAPSPLALAAAQNDRGLSLVQHDDGRTQWVPVRAWYGDADPVDERMLDRCTGPTVDLGCGPGRLTAALARRRVPALGVDLSGDAVARTRARGAAAVRGDVLAGLPAEGLWSCALLADGNIGIGGDPDRLLGRVRGLVAPAGSVVVEVDPRRVDRRGSLRIRRADGSWTDPFPWAVLGVDALVAVAARQGWCCAEAWRDGGRAFAALARRPGLRAAAPPAPPPAAG